MAKGVKTGGRKKGSRNKLGLELKDMILTALHDSGGVDYLKRQADGNPTAFMSLIGRVLPMQVSGDKNAPLFHEVRMVIVDPKE